LPSLSAVFLRWRLIERWTGGVSGLLSRFPDAAGDLSNDRWNFPDALTLLASGVWLAGNVIASRQAGR